MTPRPIGLPNEKTVPLPKYCQLREALRAQIEILQAGQPIPSETELCLAHDAGRIMARNAPDPAHAEIAVVAAQ